MEKDFIDKEVLKNIYEIELSDEDNFFEDSEDLYVYYFIRDRQTGVCVSEGMHLFDADFMNGVLNTLTPAETMPFVRTCLEEHLSDLLSKRNVHVLHPYVRDLVFSSATSLSGMYFVECFQEMTEEERAFFTEDTLDLIRNEVEKEGLSDYIEVGCLDAYENRDGVLIPSKEPVITVYMGVGTLFDLSEKDESFLDKQSKIEPKASLNDQISSALLEQKETALKNQAEQERS